jgi:hypothetical protein
MEDDLQNMSYPVKLKFGFQLSISTSQFEPELGTAQPQLVVTFVGIEVAVIVLCINSYEYYR